MGDTIIFYCDYWCHGTEATNILNINLMHKTRHQSEIVAASTSIYKTW